MAKKERQRRSARQARAQERAERKTLQGSTSSVDEKGPKKSSASASQAPKKSGKASKPAKAKRRGRIRSYLAEVRSEMHRVVWPDKAELRDYSVAVIAMLIVVGVVVWLVDTGFVALLVGFTGLRG